MLPSGGGIRVVHQFVNQLSKSFDVSLHVPCGGTLPDKGSLIRSTEYPFPMWIKPRGIMRPLAPVFLMLRLLSFKKVCMGIAGRINETADIALVHNSMPVAAPPVLGYLKIPSVYFCFEHPRHIYEGDIIRRTNNGVTELALKPLSLLEKKIDLKSASSANQVVALSDYMRKTILSIYGIDAHIIRPGVNSDFFHPPEEFVKRDNFVLSVGAMWPFKGHDTAIRAVGMINRDVRPDICIVADREYPGYKSKLTALADSLSVKLIIQQGINDFELRELYQRAQAVLCCQRREPYGLVPLEAMACEAPVIAIKEGGFIDNVIDSENGFLVPPSADSAAKSLLRVLTKQELGRKTGSSGRDFVRRERTIAGGAGKLEEILEKL